MSVTDPRQLAVSVRGSEQLAVSVPDSEQLAVSVTDWAAGSVSDRPPGSWQCQ